MSDMTENNKKRKVTVHTYGCPRIGNQGFAKFFDNMIKSDPDRFAHLRIVNGNDLVPRVPCQVRVVPWSVATGFRHPTTGFVWMDRFGASRREVDSGLPPFEFFTPVTKLTLFSQQSWLRFFARLALLPAQMLLPGLWFVGGCVSDHLPGDYTTFVTQLPVLSELLA